MLVDSTENLNFPSEFFRPLYYVCSSLNVRTDSHSIFLCCCTKYDFIFSQVSEYEFKFTANHKEKYFHQLSTIESLV